jgi:cephalosporin-C deacetylase
MRWTDTLCESRRRFRAPQVQPVDTGISLVLTHDVTFSGFDGQPIKAWLQVPVGADEPLPCVVEYVGYGGGRGLPHEHLLWACAGFAHLVMDNRGQGSGVSVGDTDDPVGSGPAGPGVLTRGVRSFDHYYYRRLQTDAVLAVDAVTALPMVDPHRLFVGGASQGGGLALAVAGLRDDLAGAMVDVPFLCDVPRAMELAVRAPYDELVNYLAAHRDHVEDAGRTLSYVDGAHHAAKATVPALFSVALMDPTCMPSTVYAAYNAWAGPKTMVEYPYNGHEGGGPFQRRAQLDWVNRILADR